MLCRIDERAGAGLSESVSAAQEDRVDVCGLPGADLMALGIYIYFLGRDYSDTMLQSILTLPPELHMSAQRSVIQYIRPAEYLAVTPRKCAK